MEFKDLMHSYNMLKITKANNYILRTGYYAIAEIKESKSKSGKKIIMSKGFYSHSPTFHPHMPVDFEIHQLWNYLSSGPKSIMVDNLVGMVIKVERVSLKNYDYKGKPSGCYIIDWDFVGELLEVVGHHRLKEQLDKQTDYLSLSEDEQYDIYLQQELEIICLEQDHFKNQHLTEENWLKYLENEMEIISYEDQLNNPLINEVFNDEYFANKKDEELNSLVADPTEDDIEKEIEALSIDQSQDDVMNEFEALSNDPSQDDLDNETLNDEELPVN